MGYSKLTFDAYIRDPEAWNMELPKWALELNNKGYESVSAIDFYDDIFGEDLEESCVPEDYKTGEYGGIAIERVKKLDEYGIAYQRPAGGHAIFVDASKVLTHVPKEEFPAQTLTIELYLEAGIRGCEIGYLLADRDPVTRENRFGGLDFLRLAIPRRVYTNNHMDVIAAALKNVKDRAEQINHGYKIAWEAPLMRHFTVKLEPIK